MVTLPRLASTLAAALIVAATVAASPVRDPIVRVREGGESIPIDSLPFMFDFGSFPSNPDADNCTVDTELVGDDLLPRVSCGFQNRTGMTISLLELGFNIPDDAGDLAFFVEDPDGLFAMRFIDPEGALFEGGGIPSVSCDEAEPHCTGGEFIIDLVGFPQGSGVVMDADEQVPEPGALFLLATGAAVAGLRRRRAS
jgi:hypothetical protein